MKIPDGYVLDVVEDDRNIGGELFHRYVSEPIDKGDYLAYKQLYVFFENDGINVNRKYTKVLKAQKFLCVNGPLEGQKHTLSYAEERGYSAYNKGGYLTKNQNSPKCVLVFFSTLGWNDRV